VLLGEHVLFGAEAFGAGGERGGAGENLEAPDAIGAALAVDGARERLG